MHTSILRLNKDHEDYSAWKQYAEYDGFKVIQTDGETGYVRYIFICLLSSSYLSVDMRLVYPPYKKKSKK